MSCSTGGIKPGPEVKKKENSPSFFPHVIPLSFKTDTNRMILHQLVELKNLEQGHSIKEVMPLNVFTRKKKHQERPLIICFTAKHVRRRFDWPIIEPFSHTDIR